MKNLLFHVYYLPLSKTMVLCVLNICEWTFGQIDFNNVLLMLP